MKSRLQLYGITGKYVVVDTDATEGAIVGKNLRWSNGDLVTEDQLKQKPAASSGPETSDDVDEGQFNQYFTDERAQDAVGAILQNTATIDLAYDDNAPSIKATLRDLATSVAGTLVGIARDAKGRVSGTKPVVQGDGIGIVDNGSTITISLVGIPIYLVDEAGNQLTDDAGNPLIDSASTGLPVQWADVQSTPTTRDGYGITDVPLKTDMAYHPPYTMGAVPPAAANQWKSCVITDLTGGPVMCMSDGTNWRRVFDNSIAVYPWPIPELVQKSSDFDR